MPIPGTVSTLGSAGKKCEKVEVVMPIPRSERLSVNLKTAKDIIIKNKFVLIIFIFGALFVIYGGLIFLDLQGPTSEYDKKFIDIHKNINGGGGTYSITGMYQSKGVISANKEIEFTIFEVEYYLQKESFEGFVGKANIWPDNISVDICPDNSRAYGDSKYPKSPCITVLLEKAKGENSMDITYWNRDANYSIYFYKNNIEFLSSGQKALRIQSPLRSIVKENIFEIEPYSTYLQIELQKNMYVLALFGFVIIMFQFYEFAVKHFKK